MPYKPTYHGIFMKILSESKYANSISNANILRLSR
uniref:Uncharacterized protein n=1 Tax=Parascaris equorum TaxID=6256 RepID=A0A914R1C7_PAREQ